MEQPDNADEKIKKSQELDQKIAANLQHISQTIAILSGKGGVGKTTVAVNLAYALAMQGYETGLLDADIHGPNVAKMMGIEDKVMEGDDKGIAPIIVAPHLKVISLALMLGKDMPVIWRGPLKTMAIKQFIGEVNWGDLDFLIVDLPPGTGDEPLSVAQVIKGLPTSPLTTICLSIGIRPRKFMFNSLAARSPPPTLKRSISLPQWGQWNPLIFSMRPSTCICI